MHTATRDPLYPDARILSAMQGLMLQNLRTTTPLSAKQVIEYLTAGTPVVGVYRAGGFRVAVPSETPSEVLIKELLKDNGFVHTNRLRLRETNLYRMYTWYAPALNQRTAPYLGGIHD
jgi:hypothetical protein